MNKNLNTIHETALLDIIEFITDSVNPIEKIKAFFGNSNYTNLAKATSNLVLTFPVIVDESVPIKTAGLVSKAVESKALVMLQILFSAISARSLKNSGNDVIDVISKYHTNLNVDNIEDYIQKMDSLKESVDDLRLIAEQIRQENITIDSYIFPNTLPLPLSEAGNERRSSEKSDVSVLNNEIKKSNEMAPSLMVIKFFQTADDKSESVAKVVIGVKAKIQYVQQEEVIYRIASKNKDRNSLFNFIRSTTREISFWKDFIFALDKAKIDALRVQNSADPIWKLLERRAIKNRVNGLFGRNGNSASAIASMVISMDTLNVLKKEYDLKGTSSEILTIMDGFNLIAFFIADEVREKLTFIYDDNSKQFQQLAYTALEKDENKQYKKIINLLVGNR